MKKREVTPHWLIKQQSILFPNPHKIALLGALLTMSLLLLIWWQVGRWYETRLLIEQRARVTLLLTPYDTALTAAVNQRFALLTGLKAFVLTESNAADSYLDANFETLAGELYLGAEGVRNFAIAPNGVHQYVYPLVSNEMVPGHDLVHDERPHVQADVQQAIQSGQIVLSDPYELRQGGLGLVARQAIYSGDEQRFWGLVAMVLDMPPILEEAGFNQDRLALALADSSGQVFYGQSDLFEAEPVIHQIKLLDETWELAGTPNEGWQAAIRGQLLQFQIAGLIIISLLSELVYLIINRQARLTLAVQNRTQEIVKINHDLESELAERKRAEAALEQYKNHLEMLVAERTNELTKSNRELQEFVYVVSHDLKAPLRKIQVFGDRLQAKYSHVLDEKGVDYITRMEQAAAQMQGFIEDLLTLSQVTTKTSRFDSVDLTKVVKKSVADLETYIEQVRGHIEVSELPTIEADATQMWQLFQNLISNALKFHREDVAPIVKIQSVDEPEEPNEQCQVVVVDNGVGIEAESLERIFGVFQRVHGSQYEGTGIGLATCRRVVERHNGTITVKSKIGKGSTFIITLPINQAVSNERG